MTIIIVNPIGNFPLNDDWSFALTVKYFLEHGDFQPIDWASMTQLTNTLWGALFCLPAGFSFTALRLSTLVISLVSLMSIYILATKLDVPRHLKYLIVFMVIYNPVFHALSYTFMTDVLFASLMILSVLIFSLYFKTDNNNYYYFGIFVCVVTVLSRQLALAIPLAFFIAYLFKNGLRFSHVVKAIMPVLVTAIVLFSFQEWMKNTDRLPAIYFQQTNQLLFSLKNPLYLLKSFLKNLPIVILYVGIFLLPIVILHMPSIIKYKKKYLIFCTLLMLTLLVEFKLGLMPLSGNILVGSGIGPLSLTDTDVLGVKNVPYLSGFFWGVTTLLSLISGIFLVSVILFDSVEIIKNRIKNIFSSIDTIRLFLLLTSLIYLTPLMISSFFDRYLIVVAPLVALFLYNKDMRKLYENELSPRLSYMSFIFLFLLAVFSILTTKDYLNWNSTRWQIVKDLQDKYQIPQSEIDGGFEVNGFYAYNPNYTIEQNNSLPWVISEAQQIKSPWWVNKDTYMIAFGILPNYQVVQEYHYKNLLPPRDGKLLLIKRVSE